MPKIKTSELTDAALDWAVAKCEGALHPLGNVVIEGGSLWLAIDGEAHTYMEEDVRYEPSFDWSQGGPIIEREGIDLYCNVPASIAERNNGWLSSWRAKYHRCGVGSEIFYGPTPLIAAMRCYVASKLGDEVEIPEELTP